MLYVYYIALNQQVNTETESSSTQRNMSLWLSVYNNFLVVKYHQRFSVILSY